MANNKRNKYTLIYIVQEYTLEMQKKGIPNNRILERLSFIYPMSKATFYNYMAINAKRELRAMNVDLDKLKKRSEYINSIIPEECY